MKQYLLRTALMVGITVGTLARSMILSSFIALVPEAHASLTSSGPIVINGQNGTVITGLKIASTTGDCVQIINSTNITIKNSEIGPCGTNNTTANSRGIYISGGSNNNVYDNYVHVETKASGCCDSHDGVLISGSSYDRIQGNVIAYSESNIQTLNSDHITITGNFLLNPRGPFPRAEQIQAALSTNITVTNNFTLSTNASTLGPAIGTSNSTPILFGQTWTNGYPDNGVSDNINFWNTSDILVDGNYISGGVDATGAQYKYGCGLIADDNSHRATFSNNTLVNTGQCAISFATGNNHVAKNNKMITLNPVSGGGNTALSVWNQYASSCGPVTVDGNIATLIRTDGYASGYWNGGGCAPVTALSGSTNVDSANTFDYGNGRTAYNLLAPITQKLPTPKIPSGPKNCVANSPYTTNTSLPLCDTSVAPDTTPPSTPTNLTAATVSSSQINLSWIASTDNIGVQGYKVFRNSVQIATVTSGTSYSDTGRSASTTYYYTVSAFDAAGNTSARSNSASATTKVSAASGAVNVSVALSSGDAEEQQSTGRMYLNSSDLELTEDPGIWGSTAPRQVVGMRFANITIPKGATIINAYIQFTAKEKKWTNATPLTLRAQASDSSAAFTTTAFNLSSRPLTSASVSWSPVVWSVVGEMNTKERTPNLASVIQEVVNRSGWISGNSIAVIVKGSGHRTAWAYDGSTSRAPILRIEFAY